MFRVPQDTVLRRVAATSLLVMASALAGCGSDGDGNASVPPASTPPATATTPPPATTPAATTPAGDDGGKKHGDQHSSGGATSPKPANAIPDVSDTKEGPDAIKAASPKKDSKDQVKADMDTTTKALKEAGFDPTTSTVSGDADGAIQAKNTTIVFYPSERRAAEAADKFQRVLAANPAFGRIARGKSRVYILSTPKKISAKDRKDFKKIRAIVDAAL